MFFWILMFTVYIGRLRILGTARWFLTFEKNTAFVYEISYFISVLQHFLLRNNLKKRHNFRCFSVQSKDFVIFFQNFCFLRIIMHM